MITTSDVSIICPSKGRPDGVARLLFTIPHRPLILVVTDPKDLPYNSHTTTATENGIVRLHERDLRDATLFVMPTLGVCQAVQFGIEQAATKIVIPIADDVVPELNWLENAVKSWNDNFGDDELGGLIHINHKVPGFDHLAMFPMISKRFYMEFVHPQDYERYMLDDEITAKAKALGRYARAINSVLRHDHKTGHDWDCQKRDNAKARARMVEFLGTAAVAAK